MATHSYLSAGQIRAARGLLGWSQEELASAANLSIGTIRQLENGHISPRGNTTNCIRRAFEDAGLEFIEPDGVRHRPDDITVYQGSEGVRAFFDSVYQACLSASEVVQIWPSTAHFTKVIGDYRVQHTERMIKSRDSINMKCIITEDPKITAYNYCVYRYLSRHYIDSVPFYIYGDKYAVIAADANPAPRIIVIQSRFVAEAFRKQFYSMWDKATPLNVTSSVAAPPVKKRKRTG